MQTTRLLCLLLLLGLMAQQIYQRPSSEPSNSTPRSVEQRGISASISKDRSQAPRSTVQTSGGQVHQNQSSNPKAGSNASLDHHLELQVNPSRSAHTDVVSKVIEDLQVLGQACLEYRKSWGKFPPSIAALKTLKTIDPKRRFDIRHGYRFTYTRRHSADSFTVNADPFAPHLRGMPRFSIDESQVIKRQQAERAKHLSKRGAAR